MTLLNFDSKIVRAVTHAIVQAVACWAQNPDFFRPLHVCGAAALSETLMAGLVCNFGNSVFPACLACGWRVRVQHVKSFVLRIWAELFSCLCAINRLHCRAAFIEFAHRLRIRCFPAFIGAEPFIVLPWPDREDDPTDATCVPSVPRLVWIFLAPPPFTARGTEFSMRV